MHLCINGLLEFHEIKKFLKKKKKEILLPTFEVFVIFGSRMYILGGLQMSLRSFQLLKILVNKLIVFYL